MHRNEKEKSQLFWDRVSGWSKAESAANSGLVKYLNQKFGTDIKPGDNVLDFGCGTGTVTLRIAQNANKVYGVDFSEGMLKRARQNLNHQRIENTDFFSIMTLYDMFEENYFDVVTIFNVLQYIDYRKELLKQFYTLLRPSGILIIVAPCFGETNSFSSFFRKSAL